MLSVCAPSISGGIICCLVCGLLTGGTDRDLPCPAQISDVSSLARLPAKDRVQSVSD